MKKLFICASVLVFSFSVNAQQKISPSFRNYLNNRNSFLSYNSGIVTPPTEHNLLPDRLMNRTDLKIDGIKQFLAKDNQKALLVPGNLAVLLPNGNNFILLPQDNMPCIVPDQSQFNMPVEKSNNELDKKINGINP